MNGTDLGRLTLRQLAALYHRAEDASDFETVLSVRAEVALRESQRPGTRQRFTDWYWSIWADC